MACGASSCDRLPEGLRVGERGDYTWVTNFSSDRFGLEADADVGWLVGEGTVGAYDVAVADGRIVDGLSVERLDSQ